MQCIWVEEMYVPPSDAFIEFISFSATFFCTSKSNVAFIFDLWSSLYLCLSLFSSDLSPTIWKPKAIVGPDEIGKHIYCSGIDANSLLMQWNLNPWMWQLDWQMSNWGIPAYYNFWHFMEIPEEKDLENFPQQFSQISQDVPQFIHHFTGGSRGPPQHLPPPPKRCRGMWNFPSPPGTSPFSREIWRAVRWMPRPDWDITLGYRLMGHRYHATCVYVYIYNMYVCNVMSCHVM